MSADSSSETREDVLHVPNLFEYFCMRTSVDMRSRGGSGGRDDAPATSFASLIISILMAFAFYVFGKPALAKATFVLFGVLLLWTAWGVIIRSSERIGQKADNIKSGVFPPDAAPFVVARLKWWNHLVVPLRWGKHSRLFDRRGKLERKIEEMNRKLADIAAQKNATVTPPSEVELAELASQLNTFSERNDYEVQAMANEDEFVQTKNELTLYMALLHKLDEMAEKLDRIERLQVVFHSVSPDDLSQVVNEAIQLLEERRILVLNVDAIDPDDFIDLVTVRIHEAR